MANTYTLIASTTVGAGGASSIDFTSIPSTYTDLVLLSSIRTSRAAYTESLTMTFNGTSSSRTNKRLYNDGSANASTNDVLMYGSVASGATATAGAFGNSTTYIFNYAGSLSKSSNSDIISENNATNAHVGLNANLWSNTAAVNQITLTPENGGTIQQYSTAYLYGIKNS